MEKIYIVKSGAIIKEVPFGSLQWYEAAGWKVLREKKVDKTNSKKTTSK